MRPLGKCMCMYMSSPDHTYRPSKMSNMYIVINVCLLFMNMMECHNINYVIIIIGT